MSKLSNLVLKSSVLVTGFVASSAFATEEEGAAATNAITQVLDSLDTTSFLAAIGAAGAVLIGLNFAKAGVMKVIGMINGGAR